MFGQVRYIKNIFKKLTKVKPARLKLWAFLFFNIMEIWKELNKMYLVSNLGNFRSLKCKTDILLKKSKCKNGYLSVSINNKNKLAHRLVALAFISNNKNKTQVNHINGIKTDNRVENLEWCTNSENQIHGRLIGIINSAKGINHARAKLLNIDVLFIRNSLLHPKELSIKFNVSVPTIYNIKAKRIWKHL